MAKRRSPRRTRRPRAAGASAADDQQKPPAVVSFDIQSVPPPPSTIRNIEDYRLRQRAIEAWNVVASLHSMLSLWIIFLSYAKHGRRIDTSTESRIRKLFPALKDFGPVLDALAAPDHLQGQRGLDDIVIPFIVEVQKLLSAFARFMVGPPNVPVDDILARADRAMGVKITTDINGWAHMEYDQKLREASPEVRQIQFDLGGVMEILATAPSAVLKDTPSPPDRPKSKRQKGQRVRDPLLEARDKWICELVMQGEQYPSIAAILRKKVAEQLRNGQKAWRKVSKERIWQIAREYAKSHDLDPPPSRQGK